MKCPKCGERAGKVRGGRQTGHQGDVLTFRCRANRHFFDRLEKLSLTDEFPWYDGDGVERAFEVSRRDIDIVIRTVFYGEWSYTEACKIAEIANTTFGKIRDWLFQWIDNEDFRAAIRTFEECEIPEDTIHDRVRLCRESYRRELVSKRLNEFHDLLRENDRLAVSRRPANLNRAELEIIRKESKEFLSDLKKISQRWLAKRKRRVFEFRDGYFLSDVREDQRRNPGKSKPPLLPL